MMRSVAFVKRYVLIVTVCASLVSLRATAREVPEVDTQWWQEVDVSGSLPDSMSYLFAGFSRISDNDPNPTLTGGGAFLSWTHGALGYTLGYLHAQVRIPSTGDRLNANLPIAAITGTIEEGVLAVSDRLRIEDLIGVRGNPWRYRNLISIAASPRGLGPIKALALSDEIFIDVNSTSLTRNRLLAGPMIDIAEHVELTLDYVNERDIGGRPGRIRGGFVDLMLRF